jgi:hypothetical protein
MSLGAGETFRFLAAVRAKPRLQKARSAGVGTWPRENRLRMHCQAYSSLTLGYQAPFRGRARYREPDVIDASISSLGDYKTELNGVGIGGERANIRR